MIKTDCAVHTILHPSFKRAKRQMVCAGRSIETFVCVCGWVCVGEGKSFEEVQCFWDAPSILSDGE